MEEPFVRHRQGEEPEIYTIDSWIAAYPGLTAGFSGRNGGIGNAPYHSLNLGLHVGDRAEDVAVNRQRLAEAVGVPLTSWTFGEQVHGCEVQTVEREHAGRGIASREDAFQSKDAFITADKGIVLAGLFADCVPLFFVDPEHEAVGLAHAGWKGTALRIAEHTIRSMEARFHSRRQTLRAAIGPSIGSCCYEVDDKTIDRLAEGTGIGGEPYFTAKGSRKFMLNLQEINRQIMIEAGIMPQHIEITTLCTGCNLSHFFSHRKEQGLTGRMAAWVGWR